MKYLTIILCAAFLLVSNAANAGTWTKLNPKDFNDCGYLYSGQINRGDFVNFHRGGLLNGVRRICLDSPGGSFAEAFDFIKQLGWENTIGTRVRSGDSCLSACAIIFMFGQNFGANSPYPSRELEPGAKLGFHSPFPADHGDRTGRISTVLKTALEITELLVDNAYTALSTKGPGIPPEIVAIMLDTPGDKMYLVDTIGEIQMLGIDMTRRPGENFKLRNNVPTVARIVRQICASSQITTHRQHYVKEGYSYTDLTDQVAGIISRQGKQKLLHLKIVKTGNQTSIVGVDSGGYHIPGLYSNAAALYCRVEFFVQKKQKDYVVSSYRVDFGRMTDGVKKTIPKVKDATIQGVSIGLISMNRKY